MRGWHFLKAFLVANVIAASTLWGQSPEKLLAKDFPVLASRLQANQAADFIVLVDCSYSMRPFWNPVRQALSEFVGAIPEGDYVSLVKFGTQTETVVHYSRLNLQTRKEIIQAIEQHMPEPRNEGIGRNTDLGRAMAVCLGEMNHVGGNRLKFVFILTDFYHERAPESPYDSNPSSSPWETLARQEKNEQAANIVESLALLMPLGGHVGQDIALVEAVLPGLEHIGVTDANSLSQWFKMRQAEIARDKLRIQVRDDIRKPLLQVQNLVGSQGIMGGEGEVGLVCEPSSTRLVRVQRATLDKCNLSLALPQSPEVIPLAGATWLPPKDGASPEVRIGSLRLAQIPWVRAERTGRAKYDLQATVYLEPSEELKRLNIAPQVAVESAGEVPAALLFGRIPMWAFASLAALLALAVFSLWLVCRPLYIAGELVVYGPGGKRVFSQKERLRECKVGNIEPGDGFAIDGAGWSVIIRAFTNCPFAHERKPRGLYLRTTGVFAATLRVGGAKVPVGSADWVPLPKGAVLEIGKDKMRWC